MELRQIPKKNRALSARTLSISLAIVALLFYFSALLFGPIVNGDDTVISFAHLSDWTAALRSGNPLSVWAPSNSQGYGSPMPFFYHKLFNLLAAALVILSGDIVTGYRLAIVLFSTVMFIGAYRCAIRLDLDRESSFITATACLLAPFSIGNFAVRGDVAEYSSMALVPWILAIVLDYRKGNNRIWHVPALALLLVLLVLAHSFTFVLAMGALVPFAGYLLATSRKGRWEFAAALIIATTLFIGLIYVPFTYWAQFFCPNQASIYGKPIDNFVRYIDAFVPSPASRSGYIGVALLIAIYLQIRSKKKITRAGTLALGLAAIALLQIALTLPISKPLWQLAPELDVIQFPWRILTIATPIAVVALFGLVGELAPPLRYRVQIILLLVTLFNVDMTLSLLKYRPDTPVILSLANIRHRALTSGFDSSAQDIGQYFPASLQKRLNQLNIHRTPYWQSQVLPIRRPLVEMTGCTPLPAHTPYYFDTLTIPATCSNGGEVRINQFSTPFLESTAINDAGVEMLPAVNTQVINFSLPSGHWIITVRQRTYMELVEMAWSAKLHLPQRIDAK